MPIALNILFISSQFPNSAEPNKGIFSLQIVREMSTFEDIRVISPVPSTGIFKFLGPFKKHKADLSIPLREVINNITIHHPSYNAIPKMGFLHHATMYNMLLPVIEGLHDEWRIDAVNCHWIFPDGVAVQKICERLNIPLMLTALGTDLNLYMNFRFRRHVIKKALVRADRVSVLSKPMYEKCIELGISPERLAIIPNGVDLEKFVILERTLSRKKLRLPEDGKIILFIGSLVPVKGVESLLRAFALLSERDTEASRKLYIVGTGYLDNHLKKLSVDLGIGSNTEFVGPVEHSRLNDWMNAADCLCLPSLSEGHPNVMMEAIACGTPVVATSVGSIPDFVNSSTGYLTTPMDHIDMSSKLRDCLIADPDRGKIRDAVKNHSWRDCAKKYISEIAQMLTY